MKKLTLEILASEYNTWCVENGQWKNNQGLRFGQYIHNNYEIDLPIGEVMNGNINDGFYTEKAVDVYEILCNVLDFIKK